MLLEVEGPQSRRAAQRGREVENEPQRARVPGWCATGAPLRDACACECVDMHVFVCELCVGLVWLWWGGSRVRWQERGDQGCVRLWCVILAVGSPCSSWGI